MNIITSIKNHLAQRNLNKLSDQIRKADELIVLNTAMRDVLSDIRTDGGNPLVNAEILTTAYARLLNKQISMGVNEMEAELIKWIRLDYLQNYDEF